jgi:hypothetical protein
MASRGFIGLWVGTLLLALGGCATTSPPANSGCGQGQSLQMVESLYFGANKPQGVVSPQEWGAFIDEVVTPRFPQGLSVLQAAGQWRNAQGVIEREASRLLQIVHEGSARDDAAVREIVEHYKTAHQQEAVMRLRSLACVSF